VGLHLIGFREEDLDGCLVLNIVGLCVGALEGCEVTLVGLDLVDIVGVVEEWLVDMLVMRVVGDGEFSED